MATANVAAFVKRRILELLGAALVGVGLFLLLSFISFDPFDPSMDLALDAEEKPSIQNLGGETGAYFAVPGIKFMGLTCFALSLIVAVWGYKLLCKSFPVSRLWIRITAFLLASVALSGFFAVFDMLFIMPESWPAKSAGGYVGQKLLSELAPLLTDWGYAAIFSLLGIASFILAVGLDGEEWRRIAGLSYFALLTFGRFLQSFYAYARHLMSQVRSGGELETAPPLKQTLKQTRTKRDGAQVAKAPRKQAVVSRKERGNGKETQESLDIVMKHNFQLPPLSLLKTHKQGSTSYSENALQQNAKMLESVLEDFGVQGKIIEVRPGPVVTQYALEPSPGTKSSRVIGLADDIARSMSAISARIAVIPGQNAIGIELPNSKRQTVYLRELFEDASYKNTKHKLPLALGKDIGGDPVVLDLARTPHMLVAGTTGSGKSVAVNAMILSLLYKFSPQECKFIMVDPKMLELSMYQDIPHLLTPVVTEPGKAVIALKWTVREMENRYRLMSNLGVRNIEGYNKKLMDCKQKGETLKRSVQTGFDPETGKPVYEKVDLDMTPMPFIVVIVDEMADLMLVAGKDIEMSIQRLAQMARAAGIHIILATQRPSVDVITGVIKANFPTRISFQVTSKIDSRTVLGEQGAEQLLGMGDMLYMAGGSRISRVHGPFVDDKEVEDVVQFLKKQGAPVYVEEVTTSDEELEGELGESGEDDMYANAIRIVREHGKASTSFVQRQLRIGYNRAANLIEQMERDGVITQADHVGRREVIGAK